MAKIFIASDHAGIELKENIKNYFLNLEWADLGTNSTESVDYPDFANEMAISLKEDEGARGVLICGSGQGMSIRANKFSHIRAALCYNKEITELSRKHNDANVLVLGARFIGSDLAIELVKTFLNTEFEGGRHARRVEKLGVPTN